MPLVSSKSLRANCITVLLYNSPFLRRTPVHRSNNAVRDYQKHLDVVENDQANLLATARALDRAHPHILLELSCFHPAGHLLCSAAADGSACDAA